jgi:hypothetical protein
MPKLELPRFFKSENIGDSLKTLNKSFDFLKKEIEKQNDSLDEYNDFKSSILLDFDNLKFANDFMKKRNPVYMETWEDILNKREHYVKPIITIYPEKFRGDLSKTFSSTYIENIIHDWITKTYIIKPKKIDKPNYVEGQKAIIYYIKCSEDIRKMNEVGNSEVVPCVTANKDVTVSCESKRSGQVCIRGCGCVNCAGSVTCDFTEEIECVFTDNGISSKTTNRYLKSKTSLIFDEYSETNFEFVKFIVEDCIWKVDKS